MNRNILNKLRDWKNKTERKPLLLEGARQVGKTYSLLEFGRLEFPIFHHFDFEEDNSLTIVFDQDLRPEQIVQSLSIRIGKKIDPRNDLIIFDEIQGVPRAITALKYIAQKHPDWFVIASGSLLGIGLQDASFPVGKVERLKMYPMSFNEFLMGTGKEILAEALLNMNFQEPQSELVHQEAWDQLKRYFITGGLPEVIKIYTEHIDDLPRAFTEVRKLQTSIIQNYKDNIAKHSGKIKAVKIEAVLESVPLQLARESQGVKKFVFKNALSRNSKFDELEAPIHWLIRGGLIHKIPICEHAQLPLTAYTKENRFVLYVFDIGILGAMVDLSPATIINYDYGAYKGYFAENFVLQELVSCWDTTICNWQNNTSQIEFLTSFQNSIFPIEVKAGLSLKAKSLGVFQNKHQTPKAFLLCGKPFVPSRGKRCILPLYCASSLPSLIEDTVSS